MLNTFKPEDDFPLDAVIRKEEGEVHLSNPPSLCSS